MEASEDKQGSEARVDVEEHGSLLIMRYVGTFDAATFRRVAIPIWEDKIRSANSPRRTINDFKRIQVKGFRLIEVIAVESRKNKQFVERGAVIGLDRGLLRFFFDRYIALSGRTDQRAFDDEPTALEWLQSTSS